MRSQQCSARISCCVEWFFSIRPKPFVGTAVRFAKHYNITRFILQLADVRGARTCLLKKITLNFQFDCTLFTINRLTNAILFY